MPCPLAAPTRAQPAHELLPSTCALTHRSLRSHLPPSVLRRSSSSLSVLTPQHGKGEDPPTNATGPSCARARVPFPPCDPARLRSSVLSAAFWRAACPSIARGPQEDRERTAIGRTARGQDRERTAVDASSSRAPQVGRWISRLTARPRPRQQRRALLGPSPRQQDVFPASQERRVGHDALVDAKVHEAVRLLSSTRLPIVCVAPSAATRRAPRKRRARPRGADRAGAVPPRCSSLESLGTAILPPLHPPHPR